MSSKEIRTRVVVLVLCWGPIVSAQMGGIRGTVYDKDFDVPLFNAQILIAETGQKSNSTEEGNYIFNELPPGTYTLIFSKEGYTRQYRPNIVVSAGRLTEVNMSLPGEFTEMEEFVVQDLDLGGGSEAGLLAMRYEAPQLVDSISSELMSQAGASDAAGALKLVSGATVQDGKYAVVRGLPDRYVNSQLNGVRLPTSDEDKRAVELDQFPAALVESIQVSKTFTPDQQGDASGGAVNVVLKSIPEERLLSVSAKGEYNTQASGINDFLTYPDGKVTLTGIDDRPEPGGSLLDPVNMGVTRDSSLPLNYSGSVSGGGKRELQNGMKLGGFGSLYYKREDSYFEGGRFDIYNTIRNSSGIYETRPAKDESDPITFLHDVTQGTQKVQWGLMGTVGAEVENHSLSALYMHTHVAENSATLLEDTQGVDLLPGAKFHRSETVEYSERVQSSLQFKGEHTLETPTWELGRFATFLLPEIDWTLSYNRASTEVPDKRLFSSEWSRVDLIDDDGNVIPDAVPKHLNFDPGGTGLGFAQRIWKDVTEESTQFKINAKQPFEQWGGHEGYTKVGVFQDRTEREYNQSSYDNIPPVDRNFEYIAEWEQFWSNDFNVPLQPFSRDIDYEAEQEISAIYYMMDLPLYSNLKVIGGARHEYTDLEIVNKPEDPDNTTYLQSDGTFAFFGPQADVSYTQTDTLPSLSAEYKPIEKVTLRAAYSETVARQTFKELSPVMQMEYLGGDIFVGNPNLKMSALDNYDLRVDYQPFESSLISLSWFHKDVKDPIEYVQRFAAGSGFITPVNYPEGELDGWELECRQKLVDLWEQMDGFSVGFNATFIDSEVQLPEDEKTKLEDAGAPTTSRAMLNAPERLLNFNLMYEHPEWGTKVGLFYTVRGDTLVEGRAEANVGFFEDVYEKEYGTLNLNISHPVNEQLKLAFQAKNLTDPDIQRVYRSEFTSGDTVKSTYKKGMDFSLSMAYTF